VHPFIFHFWIFQFTAARQTIRLLLLRNSESFHLPTAVKRQNSSESSPCYVRDWDQLPVSGNLATQARSSTGFGQRCSRSEFRNFDYVKSSGGPWIPKWTGAKTLFSFSARADIVRDSTFRLDGCNPSCSMTDDLKLGRTLTAAGYPTSASQVSTILVPFEPNCESIHVQTSFPPLSA